MSFARVLACIALMGGAAGCGREGPRRPAAPAPGEVVQFASDTYVSCIVDQARRLDDGKGTPIALALKIVPLCQMQFAYLQENHLPGDDAVTRYGVRDESEAEQRSVCSLDCAARAPGTRIRSIRFQPVPLMSLRSSGSSSAANWRLAR